LFFSGIVVAVVSGGESPPATPCCDKWQMTINQRQPQQQIGKAAAMASFCHPVAPLRLAQWRRRSSCYWQSPLAMPYS